MTVSADRFDRSYRDALQSYVQDLGEEHLHRAYEMGRDALVGGLGVLEVATAHHLALRRVLAIEEGTERGRLSDAAGRFLAECLSPFEMSQRGTREAALALQRLNDTLENEAKRIGQALHNEAGQLLASVHIALAELGPKLPPAARKRVDEIVRLLKDSEDSLRDLSHELRPMVLENLGLLPALRSLAEKIARRNKLAISVRGNNHVRVPATIESAVYRAAQEALNNVVKHARARSVQIRVRCGSRCVSCLVQDDGVGLSKPIRREENTGLGLIGIRERLGALGGAFRIVSRPPGGTTLLLVVPLGPA
ncbi:MAG TPA: ATP-binding protein [Burkholderiaceae bacterium]|jgi:signal transduction histidine kinase|nr:ATP-binding protein [Burkholderiaceae bacterium]